MIKIIIILGIALILLVPVVSAFSLNFPDNLKEFVMYLDLLLPQGSWVMRNLNITGTLYAQNTEIINVTEMNITGNLSISDSLNVSKINPYGGNVSFFEDEDLGGSTDGYAVLICNEGESKCGELSVDRYGRFYLNSPNDDLIFNAGGDLNLNPNAEGDIRLFDETDVGDASSGKSLYIYRRASEGDHYQRFYTDSLMNQFWYATRNMNFYNAAGYDIKIDSGNSIYLDLHNNDGTDKVYVRDSGDNVVTWFDDSGNAEFDGNVGIGVAPSATAKLQIGSGFSDDALNIGGAQTHDGWDTAVDQIGGTSVQKVSDDLNSYIFTVWNTAGTSQLAYFMVSNANNMHVYNTAVDKDIRFGWNDGGTSKYFYVRGALSLLDFWQNDVRWRDNQKAYFGSALTDSYMYWDAANLQIYSSTGIQFTGNVGIGTAPVANQALTISSTGKPLVTSGSDVEFSDGAGYVNVNTGDGERILANDGTFKFEAVTPTYAGKFSDISGGTSNYAVLASSDYAGNFNGNINVDGTAYSDYLYVYDTSDFYGSVDVHPTGSEYLHVNWDGSGVFGWEDTSDYDYCYYGDGSYNMFCYDADWSAYYQRFDGTHAFYYNNGTADAYLGKDAVFHGIDFITHSRVFDPRTGNPLDMIKNSTEYLDERGNLNYSSHYASVEYEEPDYTRPVNVTVGNETRVTHPYNITKHGLSTETRVATLEQAVFDLKEKNRKLEERIAKLEGK